MTKAKASRLKVFQAQFGFYDSVVAAPSQPAALRAWGTHQNLFAVGQARIAQDEAAIAAALANPEVPLRRALGSDGPFAVEPTDLPHVPDAPKRTPTKRAKAETTKPPKPPVDRTALDTAERDLAGIETARRQEEADLRRRREDLDIEIAEAQTAYIKRRRDAQTAIAAAQAAYRKAGGTR